MSELLEFLSVLYWVFVALFVISWIVCLFCSRYVIARFSMTFFLLILIAFSFLLSIVQGGVLWFTW